MAEAKFSKLNKLLAIALAVVLVTSLFATLVQTDFGKVTLKQISIVSDQGNKLTGTLYIPKGASEESPAPGILSVHGGNSSRLAVGNYAQEFARRGYVVMSIDQSSNGKSDRGTNNFFGEEAFMEYLTTLNFVDQTRLGVYGHSMGATVVSMAEANPQFGVKAGITLGAGARLAPETPINVAVIIGQFDENTGPRGSDTAVIGPAYMVYSEGLKAVFSVPDDPQIVPGKVYGDPENDALRVMYTPSSSHLGILFNREAIQMSLDFMGDILDVDYSIDPASQTWVIREILTAVAYVALFAVIILVATMMLEKRNLALAEPANGHAKVSLVYWIGIILMAIIPALGTQKLYMAGRDFFTKISPKLFAMEHINGIIFWMICSAIFILVVNFIIKKLTKDYDWEFDKKVVQTSWKELLQYVVIAVLSVLSVYLIVYVVDFLFDMTIKLYNTEVHLFTRERFGTFWVYLPLYLIYYIAIGYVQTTSVLAKSQSVASMYLRTCWVSVFAPALLLIAWYGSCRFIGINYFFDWRFVLGVLLNFIPGLLIGAVIQVYAYRKTGKIWLGAIINSVLFAWMATSIGVMLSLQ